MGDLVTLVFELFNREVLFFDVREILGQSDELVCRLRDNLCLAFKEIKKGRIPWYQKLLDSQILHPFQRVFRFIITFHIQNNRYEIYSFSK